MRIKQTKHILTFMVVGSLAVLLYAQAGEAAMSDLLGVDLIQSYQGQCSGYHQRLPNDYHARQFCQFFVGTTKTGKISSHHRHAWGENVGWVDFLPKNTKLEIGGNILAGWIEIKTLGWVYLGDGKPSNGYQYSNASTSDYGVNNKEGNLSGYAWSENVGWINFDEVNICKKGNFSGYAWSENVGRLKFKSEGSVEYMVKTDPYPWKEIGVREEIKAANASFPDSGSESISLCNGSQEFTIPPPGASLDLSLTQEVNTREDELVLRFKDNEDRIDLRIDEKTRKARGPPKIEKINLKTYSDVGADFTVIIKPSHIFSRQYFNLALT